MGDSDEFNQQGKIINVLWEMKPQAERSEACNPQAYTSLPSAGCIGNV